MINIRGPLVRLLVVSPFGSSLSSDYDLDGSHRRLILKTKGHRLDEMDVIFGVVQEDKRRVYIAQHDADYVFTERGVPHRKPMVQRSVDFVLTKYADRCMSWPCSRRDPVMMHSQLRVRPSDCCVSSLVYSHSPCDLFAYCSVRPRRGRLTPPVEVMSQARLMTSLICARVGRRVSLTD